MPEEVFCAIYARYSTNIQKEASIEDQIRKCRLAADCRGWHILNEYIYYDKARSGTTAARDGFKEMIRVATDENCPFQRILVDDTSRIARNTREALDVFSLLSFYGVHVYYVAQNIDTSHEAAEELITINGLIDSLFIRNLSKETHRGLEGQILKGFSGGGKRYGYYSEPVYNGKVDIYGNPEADGYKLKINYDEADTIIRIFSLFGVEGYSARKIVNILNRELQSTGKRPPPRGAFWGISTLLGNMTALKGILNNEIYIGKYYWNRTSFKRNPISGCIHRFKKNRDNWIVVNNPDLQIVSDELWQKVKARQKHIGVVTGGRYIKGKSLYSTNLLTGLVICRECGGNLVIVSYKKYGCSNHRNHGETVCKNNFKVKKEVIERLILDVLDLQFSSVDCINYLSKKVNDLVTKHFAHCNPTWREQTLHDGLKKVNKEICNYMNAIKAGFISNIVKEQLGKAELRKKEIETLINDSKKDDIIRRPLVSVDLIQNYVRDLHSTLNFHPVLGKMLLSRIVDKIIISSKNNSIHVEIMIKKEIAAEKSFIENQVMQKIT